MNLKRLSVAGLIIGLAPFASQVSALALTMGVTGLLTALALWETRVSPTVAWGLSHRTAAT